jgi:hypothetical protein
MGAARHRLCSLGLGGTMPPATAAPLPGSHLQRFLSESPSTLTPGSAVRGLSGRGPVVHVRSVLGHMYVANDDVRKTWLGTIRQRSSITTFWSFFGVELRNDWNDERFHEHPSTSELPFIWLRRRIGGQLCLETIKPKGPKKHPYTPTFFSLHLWYQADLTSPPPHTTPLTFWNLVSFDI